MRLEAAEAALEAYREPHDDVESQIGDLVSDLFVIVRERHGEEGVNRLRATIDRNLGAEPESASDYRQLAMLAERDGLTSWAAKLYERMAELEEAGA